MNRLLLTGAGSLAFVPIACAAQAASLQDVTVQQTSAASGTGAQIQDIVVTANRRSESQQKVPIVVSAFKGETLRTLGIKTTADLPQLTPGLTLARTLGGFNPYLRGVGTTSAGFGVESQVATYVDGLYLPGTAGVGLSFNNIERIEVLKGPQGTLYGRNSTGGLINIITKEPGKETSVDVSATYANYDTVDLKFYGSTPLSDSISANIAATYTNQADGWGRNTFLDTKALKYKDFGVQSKIKWEAGPDTNLTIRALYDKSTTDQGNGVSLIPGEIGNDGSVFQGKYNYAARIPVFHDDRIYTISLKADHNFRFATLTSTTGYIDVRGPSSQIQNGVAGNPIPGQSAVNLAGFGTSKTFSQELQLASNPSRSAFQWITGLFYYHDNTRLSTSVFGTCAGSICAPPIPLYTTGYATTRSYSGYGEGTYSISKTTRLTLGLRYTSDSKALDGSVVPLPGFPNTPATVPASVVAHPGNPFPGFPNGIDPHSTFGQLTWKAVIAQDLNPDVHTYVSYNRGFKSGGYNAINFGNPATRPEVLDSFEVGVKSELFDRMLRLNVAGFYYDYRDIQVTSTAPPAPPGGSFAQNAASARVKGIDADVTVTPARGLTIDGALELLDARYKNFPAGVCTFVRPIGKGVLGGVGSRTCDLSGFRLPLAPEFSFKLSASYALTTDVGGFLLVVSDGYKAKFFWNADNRVQQPATHLLNAALTWTATAERLSIQVFGRNLANKYYFAAVSEGAAGNDAQVPGAPRTYGLTLRYHY